MERGRPVPLALERQPFGQDSMFECGLLLNLVFELGLCRWMICIAASIIAAMVINDRIANARQRVAAKVRQMHIFSSF